MGLLKDSIKGQINTAQSQDFEQAEATIVEWDDITEVAKIKFWNPQTGGFEYRNNVRVSNSNGGVSSSAFKIGQLVNIQFASKNMHCPIITGTKENYYSNRSNSDQGAYLPNDEVYKVGTTEHLIAMNLDWINEDNMQEDKYNNEVTDFKDQDVDFETTDMLTRLNRFDKDEVGITNMQTHSTVRLKDNGDIDIFSAYNTGMRITAGGIIKMYCQDIEYSNMSGELDDTDRSIVTRIRAYQNDTIIEAARDIKTIEDTLDTIEKIRSMKHIISENKALANSGQYLATKAKIDSYYVQKAEFMDIPIEKDEQIAIYTNAFKDYKREFKALLRSMIDIRIEIESQFITPCTGYIELYQPPQECDAVVNIYDMPTAEELLGATKNNINLENILHKEETSDSKERYDGSDYSDSQDEKFKKPHKEYEDKDSGASIYSIPNYEVDILVEQKDVERTATVTVPVTKVQYEELYTRVNNIDPDSIPYDYDANGSSGSSSSSTVDPSNGPTYGGGPWSSSPVSSTEEKVMSGLNMNVSEEPRDVDFTYLDNQTTVEKRKIYYAHKQSLWVIKNKKIICSGNGCKYYFYPIIE